MFGLTRQGWYKRIKVEKSNKHKEEIVVKMVKEVRKKLRRSGTIQLYELIKPALEKSQIKLGRDKLHRLIKANHLLVPKKKNSHRTTFSNHRFRKHPDRIKGLVITRPEQVFVSDITYIKTDEGYQYLSLVTDAYSKRIMGYHLSKDMRVKSVLKAMQMAQKERKYKHLELIHHSDRGFQYCHDLYTEFLEKHNIKISMTQDSSPYDNAVAERINGILKQEFSIAEGFVNHLQAVKAIKESIELYNGYRPHRSIGLMTPDKAHLQNSYALKTYRSKYQKII